MPTVVAELGFVENPLDPSYARLVAQLNDGNLWLFSLQIVSGIADVRTSGWEVVVMAMWQSKPLTTARASVQYSSMKRVLFSSHVSSVAEKVSFPFYSCLYSLWFWMVCVVMRQGNPNAASFRSMVNCTGDYYSCLLVLEFMKYILFVWQRK